VLAAGHDAAEQVTWREGSCRPMTSAFVALRAHPRRNSRQEGGQETVSVAAQKLTPVWQLPTLPSVTEYCRATPGEAVPSFESPCRRP